MQSLPPVQDVLTKFIAIPPILQKIAKLQKTSHAELASEITRMRQEPIYEFLEQLSADMTIVYSPPKVGGQTMTATICGHPGQSEPKHVHFMSGEGLAFMEMLVERCRTPLARHRWSENIALGHWARTLVAARQALRTAGLSTIVPKPLLIVGIREPVAQYLSLVFEHWWMYVDSPDELSADRLRSQMFDDPWWHHCNTWFPSELGQAIGIDVFARPFPVERGWEIFENDTARVLVIRQENLDCFPQAFGAFRGVDPESVIMESRNRAGTKEYAATYATVKKTFRLSEQQIEAIYSQPQVRHFYSKEQIAAFRSRWCAGQVESPASEPLMEFPTPQAHPSKYDRESRQDRPHHSRNCRPCPQCEQDLQNLPVFQHACQERLELINKLDEQLRSQSLMRPVKSWYAKGRDLLRRIVC